MDSDKIILPDFLIADLYKSCLVDPGTSFLNAQPTPEESLSINLPIENKAQTSSPDKISYYGENQKNVVIVVNQPDSINLNNEDLTFLTSILKACQLSIADIAIVNIAKQQATFTEIKEHLVALKIVLFDVEPSFIKLPFMIPLFQVQKYADSTIMLAPALSALNKPDGEGRVLKTKLWNSLKQVFSIS